VLFSLLCWCGIVPNVACVDQTASLQIHRQRLDALTRKLDAIRVDGTDEVDEVAVAVRDLEHEVGQEKADVALFQGSISEKLEEVMSMELEAMDTLDDA